MVEKLKKINETLGELLVGILIFGAMVQIAGLFLSGDKLFFSVGLWCGIAAACFMAIHMHRSIQNTVELQAKNSNVYLRNNVLIRYGVVLAVLLIVYFSKLGNPVVYCLGVLGLKIAAYSQPFLHRLHSKSEKTNNDSSNTDEEVNV